MEFLIKGVVLFHIAQRKQKKPNIPVAPCMKSAVVLLTLAALLFNTEALRLAARRETVNCKDNFETHYNAVENIYHGIIYPNNIQIMRSGAIPPNTFAEVSHGRVNPLGDFKTTRGTLEYFYGLSPAAGNRRITNTYIKSFVSSCDVAASQVDIEFTYWATNKTINVTQQGFWRFDENNHVTEYDLDLLNVGAWLAEGNTRGGGSNDPQVSLLSRVNTICGVAQRFCTGANKQYESFDECKAILLAKPPPDDDYMDRDTPSPAALFMLNRFLTMLLATALTSDPLVETPALTALMILITLMHPSNKDSSVNKLNQTGLKIKPKISSLTSHFSCSYVIPNSYIEYCNML
ncbi:hypothetical protein BKA69DRAFT_1126538 [Paraphysoderma sedebokerense]|nr:hypothetical protein BKA69DRAFT_1126538 [Paraphysoderma sedebokerense]